MRLQSPQSNGGPVSNTKPAFNSSQGNRMLSWGHSWAHACMAHKALNRWSKLQICLWQQQKAHLRSSLGMRLQAMPPVLILDCATSSSGLVSPKLTELLKAEIQPPAQPLTAEKVT